MTRGGLPEPVFRPSLTPATNHRETARRMPNAFASLMLGIWPVVVLVLFLRIGLERAIIWSLLGGYLLLPPVAMFDVPLMPPLDKEVIPNLAVLVVLVVVLRRPVRLLPRNRVAALFLLTFVLGTVATTLTNGDAVVFHRMGTADPIVFYVDELPGMNPRELVSLLSKQLLIMIPFLVARAYLATEKGLEELLLALVVGGVIYAFPALLEIRISPQLNIWVYGFFQHDFRQMMRGGGFRPIVFLEHGLWAAFFFMTATISAAALARARLGAVRLRYALAMLFLAGVVVLAKSLGSQAYTLVLVPLILFAPPRLQVVFAVVLVTIAVTYPVLRQNNLVPLDRIVAQVEAINPDRAHSLNYRFENEEALLERAQEKPLFGWGGWGRNLVRAEDDGTILSIPDGEWIILFGVFGWVGYISEMGLLALPVLLMWRWGAHWRDDPIALSVAPLAVILAITMFDMLINAIITPYTWLIAGALLGYGERLSRAARAPAGLADGRRARIGLDRDPEGTRSRQDGPNRCDRRETARRKTVLA